MTLAVFAIRCAYEVAKLVLVMACLTPFVLVLLAVSSLP